MSAGIYRKIRIMSIALVCVLVILLCIITIANAQTNALASDKNPDFDANGIVGYADFFLFAPAYQKTPNQPGYSSAFDLNSDTYINFNDFLIFASYFGKKVEPLKNYFKFTFTNWSTSEEKDLVDYLCGKDEWKTNNGVYECTNMDNLKGAYKLAIDTFGEPFVADQKIDIVKDNSIDANGLNTGDRILLKTTVGNGVVEYFDDAKSVLAHELLHSFRTNLSPNIFEEGTVEAAAIIIKSKTGDFIPSQILDTYDSYNKQPIRTHNGNYFYTVYGGIPPFVATQYQLASYAWLQLYANDRSFFKKFNQEFKKTSKTDNAVGQDLNKLIKIVKNIVPNIDERGIDEWFDKNHILSLGPKNGIEVYITGDKIHRLNIFNRAGSGSNVNRRDFDIKIRMHGFNNNLIAEKNVTDYNVHIFESEENELKNNQPGRYKLTVIAKKDNFEYTDSIWLSLSNYDSGIYGVVTPYNNGTVTITGEKGETFSMPVKNGAFYSTSVSEANGLKSLRGKIRLDYNSPSGDKIARTVYKLFDNIFVVLNKEPFIYHEPVLFNKKIDPLTITARIYDAQNVKLFYRYNELDKFQNIEMKNSGINVFTGSVPATSEVNYIQYYISAENEFASSFYPIDGPRNSIKMLAVDTSPFQWKPDKIINYKSFDPAVNIGMDSCRDNGLGCNTGVWFSGQYATESKPLNFSINFIPTITMWTKVVKESTVEFEYEKDGKKALMKAYLPSLNLKTDNPVRMYIAEDGSTYWYANEDLGIENKTFEDALKNGSVARKAL